ncbi:hypothetical protein [Bacillus cereus]|uniref:hypothetical protein n=1 Tax=Bacillus cereus TaxID=1396 RepID=UPI000B4AF0DF|nr:hypothetical protein [Bacillus cereus]
MLNLTKEVKQKLYIELGFQVKLGKEEISYKNIFDAIELGGKFRQVCEGLDLEVAVVEEYI